MLKQIFLSFIFVLSVAADQTPADKIWSDFIQWAKTQPDLGGPVKYREKLIRDGISVSDADALIAQLRKQFGEHRSELMELSYDKLYSAPSQTRFTTEPSAFLVSMLKPMKPGKALDVAMGQGRNAIYMAQRGWDVTGFDQSGEALKASEENARNKGVRLATIKATFDNFDYGKERWDLVCFIYTDAHTVDPDYVAKVIASVKPGGFVLIERPYLSLDNPEPEFGAAQPHDKPNALPLAWSSLQLVYYEDTTGIADWQQTAVPRLERPHRLVRLLARKLR